MATPVFLVKPPGLRLVGFSSSQFELVFDRFSSLQHFLKVRRHMGMYANEASSLIRNQQDDGDSTVADPPKPEQLLPFEILSLSQSFPFGSQALDTQLMRRVLGFLPPITEAWSLIDAYYANATFLYVFSPTRALIYFSNHLDTNHVHGHSSMKSSSLMYMSMPQTH